MTVDGKIEVMVASSVIGYEDQVDRVCGLFEQMGYHPISSHYKTMPVDPSKSNLVNCLMAVENCDVFFGIIRPFYGTGVIGSTSITHEEMKKAIELKILDPRMRDVLPAAVLLGALALSACSAEVEQQRAEPSSTTLPEAGGWSVRAACRRDCPPMRGRSCLPRAAPRGW